MKKWSYFLIALFTLSACEKETLENPQVTDHQAILNAHTAFFEDVVVGIVEGLRQHPDLPVEKLMANDPEALLADLEARGILEWHRIEQAGSKLHTTLENAGYFDDADLRVKVDELLGENAVALAKKEAMNSLATNGSAEIPVEKATPCYDNLKTTVHAADVGYAVCLLSTGVVGGFGWCTVGYGASIAVATYAYERCIDSSY